MGLGTYKVQTRYHMNLTTHIFLERPQCGGDVLKPADDGLIRLQGEVRSAFGWSLDDDDRSAQAMAEVFSQQAPYGRDSWSPSGRAQSLARIKQTVASTVRLIVVGAGSEPIHVDDYPGALFVAADGAVGAIDDISRVLFVVSDGDGAEYLDAAAQSGVHIVLHAHGDNNNLWKQLVEKWSTFDHFPSLTLTHQSTNEYEGVYNPGGFTDGDRALCFLKAMGRSLDDIECIGFRTDLLGAWSASTNPARKMQKLRWMKESMRRLGVEHYIIK